MYDLENDLMELTNFSLSRIIANKIAIYKRLDLFAIARNYELIVVISLSLCFIIDAYLLMVKRYTCTF